jgi:2-polyprenyl-6-methoxyphenol hydroxylase-like FAD-dependent oxidoreductase
VVHFDDGSADWADLIIGADGVGSMIRSSVAPDTAPRYAGYAAFRGLAPESRVLAEDRSLLFDRFTFFNSHRSQFLGYLVAGAGGSTQTGSRRYNWVWYRPLTDVELTRVLTSDSDKVREYSVPAGELSLETRTELRRQAIDELPPPCRRLIAGEPKPFVQAIFDYACPTLFRGNIALMGDAAFVARPHTAMGVSKAAGDAMVLRDCLRQADSLPEALSQYDRARRIVGNQIVEYGRRLGASFEP